MRVTMVRTVDRYAAGKTYDLPGDHAIQWLQLGFAKPEGAPGPEPPAEPTPEPAADDDVEILNDPNRVKVPTKKKDRMVKNAPVKKG